ncbi:MAG TPA: hypothetical protein VNS63_16625 [Blastocatellia bacterium]|nr:hypothetical protein [Blastocatellia bacterium]
MTPEEMQRAIEFLIEHHAKFATELEQSQEERREFRQELRLISEHQLGFQTQLATLGEAVIALTGMVGRVAEAQIRSEAAQLKTDEKLGELAGRLDSFILVVERYISENRNGRNP